MSKKLKEIKVVVLNRPSPQAIKNFQKVLLELFYKEQLKKELALIQEVNENKHE